MGFGAQRALFKLVRVASTSEAWREDADPVSYGDLSGPLTADGIDWLEVLLATAAATRICG